jgi:hypothetical protein
MKKTLSAVLAVSTIALAGAAFAAPKYKQFPAVATGTNTSGSATMTVNGYVQAVYVAVSDGNSTGTVAVSYTPAVGTGTVSVATGSTEREKIWRPATDRTAVDGTALSSDPPGPFVLVGETLTFAVSSSPTNVTWKCLVVVEDGK